MAAPLRVGDVAQRLGLSTDTIRDYVRRKILRATRSPTGQLFFHEEDVDALLRGEVHPEPIRETPTVPEAPIPEQPARVAPWKELAPWQTEVESARASLLLDGLEAEREQRAEERERERRKREHDEQESVRLETDRLRIEKQKRIVFQLVWIEPEFRPQVAAGIEKFATTDRVPAWLSDSEQIELIATHARSILDALRKASRHLAAEELQRLRDARCAEEERQRAESQRFVDRMRALSEPPTPPPPPVIAQPRSVAEALRRRRK